MTEFEQEQLLQLNNDLKMQVNMLVMVARLLTQKTVDIELKKFAVESCRTLKGTCLCGYCFDQSMPHQTKTN